MKYMKTLGCKLKISAKRLKNRLWAIIRDVFAVVGVFLMVAEGASEIFQYQGIFEFYRNYFGWLFIAIIIGCIIKNWDRLEYTVKIVDSPDVTITLKVCNALNNDGAVIIPTNSTFDTFMKDEFISEGSIQGQYQIKYFRNRIEELDKKLADGLTDKHYIELKDGREHNKKRYPIGTVCRINEKKKRAYFIADSDIDAKGIPLNADAMDVSQALISLWEYLHIEGNSEPYSIPLIGTGKARTKDVSRNEVVQQIILSFLAASKEYKITESLTICIYPSDFEKIEWDGLCAFLKYQSQYANVKPVDKISIGSAEKTSEPIEYNEKCEISDNVDVDQTVQNTGREHLTEREQMLVTILTGNRMSRNEIAEAMGLSVVSTNRLIVKLVNDGVILVDETAKHRNYYIATEKTESQMKMKIKLNEKNNSIDI